MTTTLPLPKHDREYYRAEEHIARLHTPKPIIRTSPRCPTCGGPTHHGQCVDGCGRR